MFVVSAVTEAFLERVFVAALPALIAAMFTGVFATLWTARLAAKRFRTEQWWERKADAYTRIVEALTNLLIYSEGRLVEAQGATLTANYIVEIEKLESVGNAELARARAQGAFLVSSETATLLRDINEEVRSVINGSSHMTPQQFFQELVLIYSKARNRVEILARGDLEVI